MRRETRLSGALERGAAFLLLVIAIAGLAVTSLFGGFGLSLSASRRESEGQQILEQARQSVLAYLTAPDLDAGGRRLGEWRQWPDLPIAPGAGGDSSEPNYDGSAETAGCAYRTWAPGAPLIAPTTSGAAARCFGRLPWRDLGLSLSAAQVNDASGLVPWVVFSPNLAMPSACLANLNPLMAATPYTGYACPSLLPYPWITVLDDRGNVLSSRVALVLILPGAPVAGQVRGAAAAPSAFLDRITINAGCPAPCVPGTYDNAAYTHADGQATVLIRGARTGTGAPRPAYYGANDEFNDRLVYITVDELLARLETHARRVIQRQIGAYRLARGFMPFAAPLNSVDGDCAAGLRFGHLAVRPGSCLAGDELTLPLWLTDAGWHRYFLYSSSSRCVRGSNACNAPGLVVGSRNDVNALLLAPGAPIVAAPFVASKNAAQTPLIGTLLSADPADYLDSVENAGGLADVFETAPPQTPPGNDRLDILE